MSTLSIRKLPKALERAVVGEAKKQGKTKTAVVIDALEAKFHLGRAQRKGKELRGFFGKMTRGEFEAFKSVTGDFSKIEEDLWK